MCHTDLEAEVQRLADLFLSRNYADAAIYYSEPLVAFVVKRTEVDRDRDATARAIRKLRDIALRAGAQRIRSTVLDVEGCGATRFTASLRWEYLSPQGEVLDHSEFRFFCRPHPATRFVVEMIEVSRVAFADQPAAEIPQGVH